MSIGALSNEFVESIAASLTEVELNDNCLSGGIPSTIGLCSRLERLRLQRNEISGAAVMKALILASNLLTS